MSHPLTPLSISPTIEGHSYSVVVRSGCGGALAEHLGTQKHRGIIAIVDATVLDFWGELSSHLPSSCPVVEWKGGEHQKGIDAVQFLWNAFQSAELDRTSVVISVGGGAQGDLVGFAAATFKRGLSVIQIPTTLLSQVDASIGGKTGINFGGIKNLIGVIHHPSLVLADIRALATLPERDLRSGMAEVLKHGIILDGPYFAKWAKQPCLTFTENDWISLIHGSLAIKAAIVAADPHERSTRKLLNFGHTIGHAVEALSLEENSALSHGEAIAIGMLAEARISATMGLLAQEVVLTIEQALITQGLPVRIPFTIDRGLMHQKIAADKKNVGSEVRFTLLTGIGSSVFDRVVPHDAIDGAIETIL
jgi:3-dehydroquinate synthase